MGFSVLYTPEYLHQTTTGLFLFRLRVPKDCQSDIGKKELKYSLKTRSLREARVITSSILSFLTDVFNSIRQGMFQGSCKATVSHSINEGIKEARVNKSSPNIAVIQSSIEPVAETPEKASQSPQEQDKVLSTQTTYTTLLDHQRCLL